MALCTRVCLLSSGHLEADGEPDTVVQLYQSRGYSASDRTDENCDRRPGRGTVRMTSFRAEQDSFDPCAKKTFFIGMATRNSVEAPFYLALHLFDQHQRQILILDSRHSDQILSPGAPVEVRIDLDGPWLCPGEYKIDAYLYNSDVIDKWEDACRFNISSRMPYPGAIFEPVIRGSIVLPDFSVSQRALT
jgi:hypothetical protein